MDDPVTAFRRVEKHFKSRHAQAPEAVKERKKQSRLLASGVNLQDSLRNGDYPVLKGQGVINLSRTTEDGQDEDMAAGWDVQEDRSGGREYEEIEVEKTDDYGEEVESRFVKGYIIGDGQ
jgi:hypothetical protein